MLSVMNRSLWSAASRATPPVRFNITETSRAGRPASILWPARAGPGTTIASELLAVQAERRGSLVVDVAPKPDHNLEGLPELDGRVHVIELSGDDSLSRPARPAGRRAGGAARGPGQLVPDGAHAPGRGGLVDADPQGRARPGTRSRCRPISGVARLGFGDGEYARIAAQQPVTTIKAPGLSLPAPGIP